MPGGRLTQGLRRAAQVKPAGIAAIDGTRRYSWSETLSRVKRAAGLLRKTVARLADGTRHIAVAMRLSAVHNILVRRIRAFQRHLNVNCCERRPRT